VCARNGDITNYRVIEWGTLCKQGGIDTYERYLSVVADRLEQSNYLCATSSGILLRCCEICPYKHV
jgi:hypothetical protein